MNDFNHFKISSSVTLIIFTLLCNHYHRLSPELFLLPPKTPYPLLLGGLQSVGYLELDTTEVTWQACTSIKQLPTLSHLPLTNIILLSICMNLTTLGTSYNWNHSICFPPFCLAGHLLVLLPKLYCCWFTLLYYSSLFVFLVLLCLW